MQAAHMTFQEETLRLRTEGKKFRQANAVLKRKYDHLLLKTLRLEKENLVLKKENLLLKQEQVALLRKQQQLEKQIESLNLIVEELRRMVFGKKKKKDDENTGESGGNTPLQERQVTKRKSANRSKESYRRSKPKDAEVTGVIDHPLTNCPDCGTLLIHLKHIIRYVEDVANLTELARLLKTIEKHIIGSGYCPTCKKRKVAKVLSPQVSVLEKM